MTRGKTRVAVIGAGLAGVAQAVALRAAAGLELGDADEVELVAIASSGEERGEALRRRLGYERRAAHWRELLDLGLDGVVIAGPNDEHADAAEAFLDAGVGVLSEKPLAGSIADAERMVAAAERSAAPALVGFSYRWASSVEAMRRRVAAGDIGEVIHVRGRYWADYSGDPESPGGWRHRGPAGTGMLADVGSHVVDLAEFVSGSPIAEIRGGMLCTVTAERPDGSGGRMTIENEDLAVWGGVFADGALGEFSVSRVTPGVANGLAIEITGTEGALRWDYDRIEEYDIVRRCAGDGAASLNRVYFEPDDPYAGSLAMTIPGAGYGMGDMLALQARAFLAALGAPGAAAVALPSPPSFAHALRNMRITAAVVESAKRGGAAVAVGG